METTTQKSLYEKLGGREGITKIVDDIVEAHMENPTVQTRFLPYKEEPEKLKSIKQHLIDFVSEGSGGDVQYKGRDMLTTHRGMNVSETEYLAVVDDIMKVLERHGVEEDGKKDMLYIAYSLKDQIVKV